MSKRDKKRKKQEALFAEQADEAISRSLQFSQKRFKKFDEIILQLYLEIDLSAFFSDRRIWKINDCFSQLTSKNRSIERAVLKNVFVYLHKNSSLISGEEYIQAVYNMTKYRAYWLRDIFSWRPASRRGTQVNELAFYLFCDYKVPVFLYKAFFEKVNTLHIVWFIHIGTGKKVKDLLNMPIPFTQKMGHYFLQAPSNLSIPEALRWAQVKGMNGTDELARCIAYSWIGTKPYEDENFWETFIRLLANTGMFNYEEMTGLIDYVREMKRTNPGYNLKGRTLQSLLRQSEEWHNTKIVAKVNMTWEPCGITGYRFKKNEEYVVLEELTESKLLTEEGTRMRHCVASYAHYCVTGRSAIFSLRRYAGELFLERLATVEINLTTRRIVQAKARMNRKISDEAKTHIEIWAAQNNLSFSPYL